MSQKHPKAALPSLSDVRDLPQDESLPKGFDSEPEGPGGLVHSLGVESVKVFALTYSWETIRQRKTARAWAANCPSEFAFAATIREFADKLTDLQKDAIRYSCNVANTYQAGADNKTFRPPAYGGEKDFRFPIDNSAAFPANFAEGTDLSGETTYELGPDDAKRVAFDQLISDVREGAYLLAMQPA